MGNLTVECTILTIICDMPERAKGDTWLGLLLIWCVLCTMI